MSKSITRATLGILLTLCACGRSGIVIYAPDELARAAVSVNGRVVGELSEGRHHYKWVGWKKLLGELNAPPRRDAIAEIDGIALGENVVRIEKPGYEPLTRRVQYDGERIEIEIRDDEVRKRSAP